MPRLAGRGGLRKLRAERTGAGAKRLGVTLRRRAPGRRSNARGLLEKVDHHGHDLVLCLLLGAPRRAPNLERVIPVVDDVEPRDLTIATVPKRYAELGDLHAGIDDAVFDIGPLLEWAERDEREGAEPPADPDA